MIARVLTALALLAGSIATSHPSLAALVAPRASDSGLVTVGLLAAGGSTVVSVRIPRDAVWVVPLPARARNVRIVDATQLAALEARTAPRYFHVTRPPACDRSFSCATPRSPVEPAEPEQPRAPQVAAIPAFSRTPAPHPLWVPIAPSPNGAVPGESERTQAHLQHDFPVPALPPAILMTVPNAKVVASLVGHGVELAPGRFEGLPSGGESVIVGYYPTDVTLRFEVDSTFSWPIMPSDSGGPRELVIVLAATMDSGGTFLPKWIEEAEPPRLYEVPRGVEHPERSAAHLAHALAARGLRVHLERNTTLAVAHETTDPRAAATGVLELPIAKRPRGLALLRFRASRLTDIGLDAAPLSGLPRSRETATAFVRETNGAASAECPGEWGACYRAPESAWTATLWPTLPALAGPPLSEAPFSTATGHPRDPSPDTPAPVSSAPSASSSPAPVQATPPKAPVPGPMQPGPRGCACDTTAPPTTDAATALVGIAFALIGAARRRHSKGELR
jgi:hypothetical protein